MFFYPAIDFFSPMCYNSRARGVAQLGRALRSGRRGRWFESSHLDSKKAGYFFTCFFLFYKDFRATSQLKRFKSILIQNSKE